MRLFFLLLLVQEGCHHSSRLRFHPVSAKQGNLSKEEGEFGELLRKIPDYYSTIGAPVPEFTVEALTSAFSDSEGQLTRQIRLYITRIYPGFIRAVAASVDTISPYLPFHQLMIVVRNLYKARISPEKLWLKTRAYFAMNRAWMFFQRMTDQAKELKKFSRLYVGLIQFCSVKYRTSNTRLKAIELLEADIFNPATYGLPVPEQSGTFFTRVDSTKVVSDLMAAIERGFHPDRGDRLSEILINYIRIFDDIHRLSTEEPDYNSCVEMRHYLMSVKADLAAMSKS